VTKQEIKVLWCDILLVFIDKLIHDARNTEHKIHERKLTINQPRHAGVMQEERIPKRHVVRSRMDIYVYV
jgi:hypothetical protein